MLQNRIRNALLAVVATLLLFNLGVMLSPSVHAMGKVQYTVVQLGAGSSGEIQQALDKQSAAGWEFVSNIGGVMIFKK